MLNKLKSKWFWIILIVVVIVVIILTQLFKEKESGYVTEHAIIADISQTVEVTGSVESADDIDLNFNRTGTLQAILVDSGDSVVKGQVLARLSAGDVASQIADARASVDIAKLQLEETLAGASTQDIEVTKQEFISAQTNYQSTIDSLENLKQTRDQELSNIESGTINTLKDKIAVAQFSLNLVYDAIYDNDADNDLYVTDIVLLNNTKWDYQDIEGRFLEIKAIVDKANNTNDNNDIFLATDSLEIYLESVLTLLTDTFDVMSITVINSTYSSGVIDTFKTNINTKVAAINTAISAVQADSANLSIRELYYQTQISEKQNSIDSYKVSMDLAQAKLNFKTAPPRDFEISSAEANIKRAQATLNRYLSDWSETVIKAPVDGIITEVNFDTGEQTSMSRSVVSMIGISTMQIEVDVPESDITKLAVGDQVRIDLDAFSSDEKFVGTVIFIDPAATNIEGVVYYSTKVSFNEKDDRIKSGMTADLIISTDSRKGVLVIPSRAIIYREGKKYVQIYDDTLIEVEVTTGLRGDGGLTEITSGLEEGAAVVTFIKSNK